MGNKQDKVTVGPKEVKGKFIGPGPELIPSWICSTCGQKNSGYSNTCGRCDSDRLKYDLGKKEEGNPCSGKVIETGSMAGSAFLQNKDPWKHRSSGMKCGSCMYFVKKGRMDFPPDPRGQIGRCRRHAPTMNGYPVVFETDWCGDHKLDETKI